MNIKNVNVKNVAMVGCFILLFAGLAISRYMKSQPNSDIVALGTGVIERTVFSPNSEAVTVQLPPKPVGGRYKGVVELGASGFNSYVVNIDKSGNYEVIKNFGESLAYEGMANAGDIKDGLKKYLSQMANQGVTRNNLHFVVSSGALKVETTKPIIAAIKASGFVVNEITAEQEGKFALVAAMNPLYKDKAFVVDIGSGNTKISWYEGENKKTIEASGSKYFQNGVSDEQVFNELLAKSKQIPVDKRELCFVIGGAPNDLAKTHGSDSDTYIALKALDTYSPKNKKVVSGLNILKAIQKETNTKFVFNNNAFFPIGFLASLR